MVIYYHIRLTFITEFLDLVYLRTIFVETGLQNLECLMELDLSYNCLTEHVTLWPLEKMSTLLWISLEGNPLSYHPKHRFLSTKYLHPCLSDSKVNHLSKKLHSVFNCLKMLK